MQNTFDCINNEYAHSKYEDFNVIIMISNKYINATKLCNQFGKEFKNWINKEYNIDLINELEKELNYKSFIIKTNNKNKLLRGTYVHKLLIPHIASWISPKFGIKISKFINNNNNNNNMTNENMLDKIFKKLKDVYEEVSDVKDMLYDNSNDLLLIKDELDIPVYDDEDD